MRRRAFRGLVAIAIIAFTGTACDDESGTPIDPSPTPSPITETFSGTVTVNGAVTFPFSTNTAGAVTATIVALTDGAAVGFSIGTSTGTTCETSLSNDFAGFGSVIFGAVQSSGTLCLRVYDVGKNTAPVNFTVEVEHF
jgi:hypothetical protein